MKPLPLVIYAMTHLLILAAWSSPLVAAPALVREGVERVLRAVGREALDQAARQAAEKAAAQAIRHLGIEAAETLVQKGGLPLLEAATRHGDEVWDLVRRVPEAAAQVGARPQQALALARRHGDDALRLEARLPGMAETVVEKFGRQRLPVLNRASAGDVQRLLGYADKADTPATREALWEAWMKQGSRLLDALDKHKGLILTGGLTLALVQTPGHIPKEALGEAAKTVASGMSTAVVLASGILALALAVVLLRRRVLHKA